MSESPSDPGRPAKGQDSINRRAVGLAAAVAVVAVLALWWGGRIFGAHEAPAAGPPAPPGTFRATAQQLKTLTFETVALHGFVSEELTEGYQQAGVSLAQARANRYADTAALFQALGGSLTE